MPSFAEYRPASLDSVLPSNFSAIGPTDLDFLSTPPRKHQPVRSRPLNKLRKPASGCHSSAETITDEKIDRTTANTRAAFIEDSTCRLMTPTSLTADISRHALASGLLE